MSRSAAGAAAARFAVFCAASLAEAALLVALASGRMVVGGRWSVPALLALSALAWLAATAAAVRLPRRWAVTAILITGSAIRLAALAGPPSTSDDLYRYAWDGRVQAAAIDSYARVPADPQLASLRDGWLWPDPVGCAALHRAPGCTRINRPAVRTIYPPVAEGWFAVVGRLAGTGHRHKAWQVAGLVTEMATLALLVAALSRWGKDRRLVALYALCPAPALEIVNNGHVDGLAVVLIVAALVVLAPAEGRGRPERPRSELWRDLLAAALLTGAVLVKLYPAVLLLPVVACRPGPRLRSLLRVGGTAVAVSALAYAPHVAAVGTRVLGYLPGYLKEEQYDSGGRFLIANLARLPQSWAAVPSILGICAVVVWVVGWRPPILAASAALLGAVLLAASPAQPWYAVTLLAVATVAARPAWIGVVVAGYFASLASVVDRGDSALIGGWAYAAALGVVLVIAGLRARGRSVSQVGGSRRQSGLGRAVDFFEGVVPRAGLAEGSWSRG